MNSPSSTALPFPLSVPRLLSAGAWLRALGVLVRVAGRELGRAGSVFRGKGALFRGAGASPFRAGWSKAAAGCSKMAAGWSFPVPGSSKTAAGCSKVGAGSSFPGAGCSMRGAGSSKLRPGSFPFWFLDDPGAFLDDPGGGMDDPGARRGYSGGSAACPQAAADCRSPKGAGTLPAAGIPALWMAAWDEGTWDSGSWDEPTPPPSDYFQPRNKPRNQTNKPMKRQNYYPGRIGDQVNWLANFAQKIPIHGPTLGVAAGDVTAAVNDAKWCHYVLSEWLSAVRAFAPSTTDAVDDVLTGAGPDDVVLPTFTAPALPAGVTAPPPGALTRIFALIAKMKLAAAYTAGIGTDLGVEGTAGAEKSVPKFLTEVLQGEGVQTVKLTFYKYGHMGVHIESRRGANGVWEFLGVDTESPYLDDRALLAAGQPEVREYRMRFWDKGTPNGDWTDVTSVTVSP